MNSPDSLHYLTVAELSRQFAAGVLSPVDLVETYLSRIEKLDPKLRAFTTLTAELAREQAVASERRIRDGSQLSPLDGIPIAMKDVFDTAGILTTANSPLFEDRIPQKDAFLVQRLRDAGVVFLGKLAMYEFSLGPQEEEGKFPPARNPWDLSRIPGGSSSGSAVAVSAGLCAATLGSDTGGSIRGPASYCGVVGLKPSAGLVSRTGVIPLAWSLDQAGPLTRTVADAALLLTGIAGYDPADLASVQVAHRPFGAELGTNIQGVRIGAPKKLIETEMQVDPQSMQVYERGLAQLAHLGAEVRTIHLPEIIYQASDLVLVIAMAEAAAYHETAVRTSPDRFGPGFRDLPLYGATYSAVDYIQAQRGRTLVCQAMKEVMQEIDLLALPTTATPAILVGEEENILSLTTLLRRLFNATGQPAISVPAGFSEDGLPVGLQLAGRLYEDQTILKVAHAFEQANSWHLMHPPIE